MEGPFMFAITTSMITLCVLGSAYGGTIATGYKIIEKCESDECVQKNNTLLYTGIGVLLIVFLIMYVMTYRLRTSIC